MAATALDTGSGNHKWKVAALISGSFLFSAMDMNSSLVALPTIAGHYGVDIPAVSWVVLVLFLTMNALLLPFGRLADIAGRKKVLIGGMIVVGIGGVLSTFAPNLPWLYGARVMQGAGQAALQAVGPALLVAAFPRNERGKAMGVNVTLVSVGLMLGPALGGLITGTAGWRYIFLLPVPAMLLAAMFGGRILQETPRAEGERFDFVGTLLLALWVVPLFFVLNQGPKAGWGSGLITTLTLLTMVMLVTFLVAQLRAAQPVVALTVFRNRDFSLAVLIALLNFIAFGATVLLLPFMLQNQMGLEVTKVGLVMATIALSTLLFASTGGILSDRYGARLAVTAGLVMRAAGLIAIGLLAVGATVPVLIAPMVAVGVGQALFQPPNASAMLSALPPNRAGLAGGFLALSRTFGLGLGQALGGAVFTMVVVGVAAASSTLDAPAEVMASGFRIAFVGAGVLLLLAAGLALSRRREERAVD